MEEGEGGEEWGPLFAELSGWPEDDLLGLFESEYAVCCLLRALPVTCRHLIMRVLYIPSSSSRPLSYKTVRASFKTDKVFQFATSKLISLKMLKRIVQGESVFYYLNEKFAMNLRQVVSQNLDPPFTPDDEGTQELSEDFVNQRGNKKWEAILHFLVGMDSGNNAESTRPAKAVIKCLKRTNLLGDGDQGSLKITSKGFQFLLRDSYTQMWILLLDIIDYATNGEMLSKKEVLLLLFKLSFTAPGKGYPVSSLSAIQAPFVDVLISVGLIYRESKQSTHFFPTRVGRRLVANTNPRENANSRVTASLGTCEIIAETNFRIYAYTSSRLQVDLISMFVHMRTRLPNLAVGHITNESVRMALRNGITADQIIGYLNAHCSPRSKDGRIPSNVSQMIRLWEAERNRVQKKPGVLLGKFDTEESFALVEKYASEIGGMLWINKNQRLIVVAAAVEDQVRQFVRTNSVG